MKVYLNELYDEKCSDVVIDTTFSISRCIKGFTFPNKLITTSQSEYIIKSVHDAFNTMKEQNDYKIINSENLNILSQKVLEESNLLPPTFNEKIKKDIIVNNDSSIAILVNFNDHLTFKAISPTFQIKDLCKKLFELEEFFASKLDFAFDDDIGYITSNIFYCGTGIREGALVSIPGIVATKKISSLILDFKNAGLTADGHYTNNAKDSMGSLYYVYNENSIGGNEQEQIFNFRNKLLELIYLEREMRLKLYLKNKSKTADIVMKAVAIAKMSKILELEEAMDVIFKINLGIDLNLVSNVCHEECNAMYYKIQVAHISYSLLNSIFKDFSAELVKIERAKIVAKFAYKIKLVNI
jgi:putative ATP:guanido phosphotransferase swol_2368